jgi:mycothiol synthase
MLRPAKPADRVSYSQAFQTAFDEPAPFNELMRKMLPRGFLVVEHLPTGAVVAGSTAGVFPTDQHPDGHSLQWVVAHEEHRATGSGQATIAAATKVLAESAPRYSYLSTDDFRLSAINIYLKLGWKPLLFQDGQIQRWSKVFNNLGRRFDAKECRAEP